MLEWLTFLLPFVGKIVEAISEEDLEKERQAMIDLQVAIAEKKAEKKFGPRPST